MTLTIELTETEAAKLHHQAQAQGVDEATLLREWIASLPEEKPRRCLTPQELLRMPPEEADRYIEAAAEEAAPLYAADLALPPQDRELTALSTLAGASFRDEGE